jgi:hypothetical protein
LIHNPNAEYPVPAGILGAGAELQLDNGRIVAQIADHFHPYGSLTLNFPGDVPTAKLQRVADKLSAKLSKLLPF